MKHFLLFIFIGFFTLAYQSNAQPLTAVYPLSGIQTHITPSTFGWNTDTEATSYTFELSSDSLFSTLIYSQNLNQQILNYSLSLSNGDYFWRITAHYPLVMLSKTSQINKFTIFTPAGNPNLKLWLAADTGVVITSGAVSQWNDLSGNNFHLTQTTASNRPTLQNNAIGNKPTVKFDGVNDFLQVNFGQTFSQPNTFFLFYDNIKNSTSTSGIFDGLNNPYSNTASWAINGLRMTGGASTPFTSNIINQLNLYIINTFIFNKSQSCIYTNNNLSATGSIDSNGTSGLQLGRRTSFSTQYLTGNIYELFLLNNKISDDVIAQFNKYINNKYAPPVSLGYDISIPYSLCDTALVGANKTWFSSWLWSTGETTPTIRVSKSGKYWVRATNTFGIVSSDTIQVNYSVHLLLPDSTICLGDTLTYTYSSANPYIISWSNGNSGSTFKTTQAGNYTVTITDSLSCSFQDSFVVAIDSFPSRNLINSDTIICSGNIITPNSIVGTSSILWTPGNETTLSKTIYNSGMYYITAQNSRACFIHDSIQILIKGTSPNPLFEWSKLCSRDTIQFTDLSYPADSVATWQWNINNGFTSNIKNPRTVFDTSGTYRINFSIASAGNCSKDTIVFIHVNKKPTANFSYLNPCPLIPTPFTNLSDLNIGYTLESNLWYIDSDLTSTEINPILSFTASQSYNVSLRVQSTDFCSDSVTQTINIPASYPQPTTFSTISPSNNAILSLPTVLFTWNSSANAQYYKIEVSKNSDFIPVLNSATQVASNFPSHTLTLDTGSFYWRVIAYNPCLDSITCNSQTFTLISLTHPNLKLWLAADTGVITVNGFVSQWNDLSGNNYNLIQSNLNQRPTQIHNILNNKSAIKFDGINDFLSVSFSHEFPQPNTIIQIFKFNTTTNNQYIYDGVNSINRHAKTYVSNNQIWSFSDNSSTRITTPYIPLTEPYVLHTDEWNYTNSKIRRNGIILSNGNTGNQNINGINLGSHYSGTQYFLNGNILEFLIFDTILDYSFKQNIETLLINKYAPSVLLGYDISIPYKLCDTTLVGANKPWFTNWVWSTGDTTSTIKVNKTGNYWVRATNIFGLISSDTIFVNYPGQQTFNNTTICLGDTLTYTYTKNLPYTITWSNGNTGSTFKTTQAGNYSMTLDDNEGCQFNTSFSVAIDSFPAKNILISDTTFCSGNKVNIIPGSGLTQVLWAPGNDTTTYKSIYFSGQYNILALNARGCINKDSILVNIQGDAPYPLFDWSKLCSRDTIQFTDLSYPADSIASWNWTIDNGFTGNNQNPSTIFDTAGNYTLNLNLVSHSGCENDTTVTIHVNKKPTANFSYLNPCPSITTPFTNLSDLNNGYTLESNLWYINNDLASNEINPSLSFSASQAYNVSLRVQSTDFCSDSVTQTINIPSSYPQPSTFSTISPSNNVELSNTSVHFRWNVSANAQYYRFEISDTADFSNIIESQWLISENFPTTSNQLIFTNKQYYWRVFAFNPCLDSTASNIASFTFFKPQDSNIKLWITADTGVIISNGAISQWNDISGNGFHLTQANTGNRPTLLNNTLGNKPSVKFDGINDYLRVNFGQIFNQPNTFFAVWNINEIKTQYLFDGISTSERNALLYVNNQNIDMYAGTDKMYQKPFITLPFISTIIYNGNSSQIFENLNLKASGNTGNQNITGLSLGTNHSTSSFLSGNLFELIFIDTILMTNSKIEIERYLSNKYAPPVSLGYDIYIPYKLCDTSLVGANKPWFTNWLWSTGDTTSTIKVNKTGNYWVRATNIFGMVSSDTIFVNYPGQQTFADSTICLGDTLMYTYTKNFPYTITWSNGNSGSNFSSVHAGNFTMTLTDSIGCSFQTSFILTLDSLPVWVSLGNDLSFCSSEILTPLIQNQDLSSLSYLWMDNSQNSSILVNYGGNYSVSVTNTRGCVGSDSIDIIIQGSLPIIQFSAPAVCLNEASHFTDESSSPDGSSIVAWNWSFGNDSTSIVQNPSLIYAEDGIYTVNLSVTTENLCTATNIQQIVVYSKPLVNFTPTEACALNPVQFNDLTTDVYQINQWIWNFGDIYSSQNTSSIQNPTHTFDSIGNYHIKLISKSIFGCSDSITKTINIKPTTLANFSFSNSCFGTPTWFNNTSNTSQWNPIMKYKWEYSNLLNDSLTISSYLFPAPGFYDVKHTITTLNGCTNSIIKPVKVSFIPIANFSNPETCLNTTYIINNESQIDFDTISNVKWYIDNNYYSTGEQMQINFPTSGSYNIKQIVISNENCSDTISKPVIVRPIPISNFIYAFDEETVGNLIHFTNTSTGSNSYFWDFNTGQTSVETNPSYNFSDEGNYNVILIAQNQYGCSDTSNYEVLISNPFMDLSILNATFENQNGYLKTTVTMVNMGNRNVFNIWIDVTTGNTINRELWSGILRPAEVISYTLRSFTPLKPYEEFIYGCASIHSDMYPNELNNANNRLCISNYSEFSIFDIYPNPATEKISCIVSTPSDGLINIKITRPDGKNILESNSNNAIKGINQYTIPISNLPSGVYFIQFEFDGKNVVEKFVVL